MPKQSGLIKQIQEREDRAMNVGSALTAQYCIDTLQIAMSEEGWGYDRQMRLLERWREIRQELKAALNPKDPECDVCQEKIERAILRIIDGKQEIIPWEERYPNLKKITYGR